MIYMISIAIVIAILKNNKIYIEKNNYKILKNLNLCGTN